MSRFPFMAITAHGNVYVTCTARENYVSRGDPAATALTLTILITYAPANLHTEYTRCSIRIKLISC